MDFVRRSCIIYVGGKSPTSSSAVVYDIIKNAGICIHVPTGGQEVEQNVMDCSRTRHPTRGARVSSCWCCLCCCQSASDLNRTVRDATSVTLATDRPLTAAAHYRHSSTSGQLSTTITANWRWVNTIMQHFSFTFTSKCRQLGL